MEKSEIIGYDGVHLSYYESYNPSSQVGILLIHGLSEHKGRYTDLINNLYELNYSIFAADLRGHGESSGKRGDVKKIDEYLSDTHYLVCNIKNKYPYLKLAVLGHSLGGLISAIYVATHNTIDFLILSSPLLIPPAKARFIKFLPYKLLGFIKVKKRHSESPEMLAYSYNDPLSTNYLTLRLLGVIFHQGTKRLSEVLNSINVPTLLLGGELDPLIDTTAFQQLIKEVGSEDCEIRIYNDIRHRFFQNEQRTKIVSEIIDWLEQRL